MDAFLVVARCGMDDIALGLFDSEKTARDFASTVTQQMVSEVASSVYEMHGVSCLFVSIVIFDGGVPTSIIQLQDIDPHT